MKVKSRWVRKDLSHNSGYVVEILDFDGAVVVYKYVRAGIENELHQEFVEKFVEKWKEEPGEFEPLTEMQQLVIRNRYLERRCSGL